MTHTNAADGDGFDALGVVEEPVEAREREGARSGYRIFAAPDGFEAAVPEQVIARTLSWARSSAPNEWYGLIVGRLCEDERGRHVVVLGVVPDGDARATTGFVETSHASEFATRTLCRGLYPDGVIVGWAHSHPRLGVRYSATDKRNQATWTQSHSLGIVVDPWDPAELTVYRGPTSEVLSRRPSGGPSTELAGDVSFRAVTTTPKGPCLGAATARSTPRRVRSVLAKVVLAAFLGALVVVIVRRERGVEHALDELARHVRTLEARPSAPRRPTPSAAPSSIPGLSTAPPVHAESEHVAASAGRSALAAHGRTVRATAPRITHP